MSFQTPISIRDAIDNISNSRYLLPAIQREFVWPHWKIEWLFDSLMRGYPISSFLFWEVRGTAITAYKYYRFLKDFREGFHVESQEADVTENFTAVLDGQQRLTSLYIGLKGSYAYRTAYARKIDNERSVPTRLLYLNISNMLDENDEEDGRVYEFSFLTNDETGRHDLYRKKIGDTDEEKWFRVGKILDLSELDDLLSFIEDNEISTAGRKILSQLYSLVYTQKHINYFLETSADLNKALNIFIRINSGGQPLNFSDLIMSIAVAHWTKKDAKNAIPNLVNDVASLGFSINKDFIFKTFLYLFNTDIRFKATNFRQKSAELFEEKWEKIRDAIIATFRLVASFGFSDYSLTSKNAVIPITFYLYHRGIYSEFKDAVAYEEDRNSIRQWLHIVLLKRVFGSQSDAVLSQIRRAFLPSGGTHGDVESVDDAHSEFLADSNEGLAIETAIRIGQDVHSFPVDKIYENIKRNMSVGDDFITELLHVQKDDRYAFSILALLFPHMDYKNNDFHKDHLHPYSTFIESDLSTLCLSQDDIAYYAPYWYNSIVNLQMLDANQNMQKQHTALNKWIEKQAASLGEEAARERALIPSGVRLEFKDFASFARKREELLTVKLKQALGN